MYGFGLIKGLAVTLRKFFSKKITQMYPEVEPQLPAASRGSFTYVEEKCISCQLCELACPNDVIRVEFYKNERNIRVLERYRMNLGFCLFCGYCVDVCPTKCLKFSTNFHLTTYFKDRTTVSWQRIAGEQAKTKDDTPENPGA